MKYIYTSYMIVFSIIRLALLMPYRTADRKYNQFGNVRWIILFAFELIGAGMFLFFKRVKGSNTFSTCLIDCICLFSQLVIYKVNEAANAKPDAN